MVFKGVLGQHQESDWASQAHCASCDYRWYFDISALA